MATIHRSPFTGEWFTDFLSVHGFSATKRLVLSFHTITGECFTQSLHSHVQFIHPIHANSGHCLFMPLFLMGCFPVDFQDVKRPLRTKSAKRPIKAGKRPINEGKRPIKAKVLVGVSVGSLMGCLGHPRHGGKRPL